LSPLIPHLIFCCTLFTHTVKLEVHLIFFSIPSLAVSKRKAPKRDTQIFLKDRAAP